MTLRLPYMKHKAFFIRDVSVPYDSLKLRFRSTPEASEGDVLPELHLCNLVR